MDWARAIEINHAALTRIVLGLIAMVGLVDGVAAARLPRALYLEVSRILRPAESAVRRLIVIAARGLKVKPSAVRAMPKGLAIAGKGGGRISFQLFDARKRFARTRRAGVKLVPRIRVIDLGPFPAFQPKDFVSPQAVPEPDGAIDAQRLHRRLSAVKLALDDLPRQAMRMARWQAQRERMQSFTFKSPLRPGQPPGHRKMAEVEIDWVLRTCHGLAWDTLYGVPGAGYRAPRSGIP